MKQGLDAPLSGMGTAFSTSLIGLSGSLVLGFLDLQAVQAQNVFYNDLEDWLSAQTRISAGTGVGESGDQSVPAYIQALLEQTADSLDNLQRVIARGEESRIASNNNLRALTERLSTLADQMKTEQSLMLKLAENQMEMEPILAAPGREPRRAGYRRDHAHPYPQYRRGAGPHGRGNRRPRATRWCATSAPNSAC